MTISLTENKQFITAHANNKSNPHNVTAAQVSINISGITAKNLQGALLEAKNKCV